MANQVRARLGGDEYQHLFSWYQILALSRPRGTVSSIRIEDEDALSVDDLTVRQRDGSTSYFQVKWHVDQRSAYSEGALTHRTEGRRSLLQKWYRSYRKILDSNPALPPIITLVSNWGWTPEDTLPAFVSGVDDRISEDFFSSSSSSAARELREKLLSHLEIDDAELRGFLRTLRFRVLSGGLDQFVSHVAERMEHLGLRSDEAALMCGVGAVRRWILGGPVELTPDVLHARIADLDLLLPPNGPRAISVYLSTIKAQHFDVEPDYHLDWRGYFEGPEACKGHDAISPDLWSTKMMPSLFELEKAINGTQTRFIRARGKARLSAWIAFGYVFSQVNGYTLEIEQNGKTWNTGCTPNPEFGLVPENGDGEAFSENGDTVAVGLSLSGSIEGDVRRDIGTLGAEVRALLLLRANRNLGIDCLKDGSDAVAFARAAKAMLREFASRHRASKLALYYFGPLGGACFLGYHLNAVCRQIQVMEHTGLPERPYVASFTLGA